MTYKNKIWAVDFDGTLYGFSGKSNYPEWNMPLINFLKERQSQGDYLILWTCRSGNSLEVAVNKAREEVGLEFDKVNDNLDFIAEKWIKVNREPPRKVYANAYIDDKNCHDFELFDRGCPLDRDE